MTMDTGAWLKTHKQEAILGAGGIVVAIALYMRSRSQAAANSGAAASSLATPNATSTYPAGYVDTSSTDLYNGLEGQITSLQSAIAQASAAQSGGVSPGGPMIPATPAPSNLVPLSDQVIQGGGYSLAGGAGPGGSYGSGTVQAGSGGYFSPLATLGASTDMFGSSPGSVYFEPAQGVFNPVGSQSQFNALEGQGTTLFTPYSTTPAAPGSNAA